MKNAALFLPFLILICTGACVEKNIHTKNDSAQNLPLSQGAFFMSKPQPTSPVELVFDEKYEARKALQYRQNEKLHISASASFSLAALKDLAKPAKKMKLTFYVFDLRQESHGYINDKLVTWQSEHDWGHVDLNHDEAVQRERRLLLETSIGSKIGNKVVQSTETEDSVVRSRGYEYLRLTVTDHLRPTDAEVDRFIGALKTLPQNRWIHFHDRSGQGRTTLFMVLYDMLFNAKTDTLEDIVKRNEVNAETPGILEIPAPDQWNFVYQKERAEFIREFYKYAQANPRGEGMLWTEWVMKK